MTAAEIFHEAELRMWLGELDAMDGARPDWPKRRIAGEQVCELVGIAPALRALARDGALHPPPRWPNVDIVPVGGGAEFLRAEVRTIRPDGRPLSVPIAMKLLGRGGKYQEQIEAALERGRFELRKWIDNQTNKENTDGG